MRLNELVERVQAGEFLVVGEYRMSKAEMLNWVDKTNGQRKSAPILRHTVEFGNESVAVNERVPDGTKLEDIKINYIKGDRVVLHVQERISERGLVACRGQLEKLTRGPGDASPGERGKGGV